MRLSLIILFLCAVSFQNAFAQVSPPTDMREPTAENKTDSTKPPFRDSFSFNYDMPPAGPDKQAIPARPRNWTSDYEKIFSAEEIMLLNKLIGTFEQETSVEIAIVTIDSSQATKENFDRMILGIAKRWGVGKKGIDNGIVIGISTGLRKIRICNGYGIDTKLTDAETKKIVDKVFLPEFKQGNYFAGTKSGLLALMQKLR